MAPNTINLPSFPNPLTVGTTTILNLNRQRINSPSKPPINLAPPNSIFETAMHETNKEDYIHFPSPLNLIKKESIESVRQPIPPFPYNQLEINTEKKISSPINNLTDITVQPILTGDGRYMSRGLAFFSNSIRSIPQIHSTTSSSQPNSS